MAGGARVDLLDRSQRAEWGRLSGRSWPGAREPAVAPLDCEESVCCLPEFGLCGVDADCCGVASECLLGEGTPSICVDIPD